MELSYEKVEAFLKVKVPQEIEDEILATYAEFSLEHDMTLDDLDKYFEQLELPKELCKMIPRNELVIEGTNVVDFTKLLTSTYHVLIFMDNEKTITEMWSLLVTSSGRDRDFPQVRLKNHVLSLKDLQKIRNYIGVEQSSGIVEMISVATGGRRVYMTYLDFAYILGKLGYLRF
ncbi:hypothetical protein HG537_0A05530 [Torulaspora globosa]|uniref:Uncharacterized protein n=1 Tax=Torulaspora globosa TaxID=48254 RepID=A0A7H9HLX2_9SACH|nr:hypothetical protein HG537_0A05530 [Torulaspora sp. CBS 2947]